MRIWGKDNMPLRNMGSDWSMNNWIASINSKWRFKESDTFKERLGDLEYMSLWISQDAVERDKDVEVLIKCRIYVKEKHE